MALPGRLATWNKERQKWADLGREIESKKSAFEHLLMLAISQSTDKVSKSLETLFAQARIPKKEELEIALMRKSLGNPPGKPQDPLGDELTWVQFLNDIRACKIVWIITSDTDYLTVHKKKCYLNPYLHTELLAGSNRIEVRCFNTLADGLRDINATTQKARTLPAERVLEKIVGEESHFLSLELSIPLCPSCRNGSNVRGPISKYLRKAGMCYQFFCGQCNAVWDVIIPNHSENLGGVS